MKRIATIVSKILDPMIGLTIVIIIACLQSGLSGPATLVWSVVLVAPPTLLRLWARRTRGLDWDIKDRRSRIVPLVMLLGILVADIFLLSLFAPIGLQRLFLFFFLWMAGFLAITTFITKISGHAAGNALASGLIVSWYGLGWWPVLLVVPLVAWARVVRRDHTIAQVVMGAAYSGGILLLFTSQIVNR